jgi:6-phosphogluconolactonase
MIRFLRHAALLLTLLAVTGCSRTFHIYAPSPTTNSVEVFRATDSWGGLTLTRLPPFEVNFAANCIVKHPTKDMLYVTASGGQDGEVPGATLYLRGDGGLEHLAPARLAHGYCHLNLDRTRRYLLGVEYGKGRVDVYDLNIEHAIGKRVAGLDEGRKAAHCVFPTPDNKFVYIPYVKDSNAIFQYAFDASTGSLTPLGKKDAGPPPNTGPRHSQYHKTMPIVYFTNEQGGFGISAYDIQTDGQLKLRQVVDVAENPPQEGTSASDLAITPDGKFLYSGVRDGKNDYNWISRWRILDNGDVSHLGLTPADKVPWGLSVSPNGKDLVATAFKGATISVYEISSKGDLRKAASLPLPPRVMDVVTR